MVKGFKDFILRGNVLDLAVAVVLGAAFNEIVKALVENIITPLVSAIAGKPDIAKVGNFTVNGANFSVGNVLQAVLNFLLIAAAIYFVILAPVNRLLALRKLGEEPEPVAPSEEILLLTQIRDRLGGADTTVVGPPSTGNTVAATSPPSRTDNPA